MDTLPMTELLTAAQMRAIEAAAIASGHVTGLELMERAGRGVVEAIFAEWPDLAATSHSAVVLCGPGNNGGDGFVVARLLKLVGWEVRVLFAGDRARLSPDAGANFDSWAALGPIETLNDQNLLLPPETDIYVDAIFGSGLSRRLDGDLQEVVSRIEGGQGDSRHFRSRTVSIDAPSGLCLDSGRMLGCGSVETFASLTVTFDAAKAGHYLAEGPARCGRLVVVDIGVSPWRRFVEPRQSGDQWGGANRVARLGLMEPGDFTDSCPGVVRPGWLQKSEFAMNGFAHKYTHGHALILSGSVGQGGAARLAARGALRIGAGAVTVGCPPSALIENAAQLNAIMLRPVDDSEALATILADNRINALCLGPGMGVDRAARLLDLTLRQGADARRTVLDADALTALARDADLFAKLHDKCILTPHAGEFARLFPDIAAKLAEPATKGPAYSKVDATRDAAKRAGCIVLFKGADTVIAHPDGRCSINSAHYDRAAPWLATAGSGDVLAGFITGLLARNFDPMAAAETAAWLHVECARSFGPGLIAEDLPEELPNVFRALGL